MTCTIACPMLRLARFRLFPLATQVHSSRTLHTLSSLALSSRTAASVSVSASASASASTSSSSASSALPISSSVGKFIKCKAAIAWKAGEPLAIEDIEVAPPKENEVRIRMVASGVCHTDAYTLSGKDPEGVFPVILGHEGGAVVESVGSSVSNVSVGDHVIPLYIPECGKCRFCKSGKTNLCVSIRATQGQGLMPDKSSRFTCRGQSIFHYMGTSTFASYSVVSAYSVAKVSKAAPLDKIALLGCGITTGIGAVRNTAKVERGSSVAVFGLGGVGLSVIQGAKLAGASRIIAVDLNDSKWPFAKRLGATDFVNPKSLTRGETVVQKIVELTDGGVDYSFEAIGSVETMRQALECTVRGWGQSCIIGVAGAGQEISTRPFQLVTGRRWLGSAFGGVRGRTELPGMVEDYLAGKIEIDGYVTHTFKLQDINKALHLMHEGKSIRSVILFDEY